MTDEEFLKEKEATEVEWRQLKYNGELQNYDISNIGEIRDHETQKPYKLSKTSGMKNTYEFIHINLNDGTKINTGIHRLMAMMFIPIPKKYIKKNIKVSKLVVDHIDDVRYHNIVSNLQWLTHKENTNKAFKNKKHLHALSIPKKIVKKICKDLCKGETIYDVATKYGYSEESIYNIRYGYTYKYITENYTFPSCFTSDEDVIKVCELLMKNKTFNEIHEITGVSISSIARISNGSSWKYITTDYNFPNRKIMTDEKRALVISVCEMLQEGKPPYTVAKELNVTKSFVQHIASRETHTDISDEYIFTYGKFKISDSVIENICEDISSNRFMLKEIAERNGVSIGFVKSIKSRKHRKDISSAYKW